MNGASRLRHRSAARSKASNRTKSAPSANRLFVFTMDADTGRIIKFETVNGSGGARRELSQEDKAALATKAHEERIEEVLEQAFEAGIACALSDELGDAQTGETDRTAEDAELRHLLLARLIDGSGLKHLMTSEVLNRAIFGTLIQQAIESTRAAGGRGATPASHEGAAPARTN